MEIKPKLEDNNLWKTKKLKTITDRNIEILINRIQHLSKEEEFTQKKIEDVMRKTVEAFDRKKIHHQEYEDVLPYVLFRDSTQGKSIKNYSDLSKENYMANLNNKTLRRKSFSKH